MLVNPMQLYLAAVLLFSGVSVACGIAKKTELANAIAWITLIGVVCCVPFVRSPNSDNLRHNNMCNAKARAYAKWLADGTYKQCEMIPEYCGPEQTHRLVVERQNKFIETVATVMTEDDCPAVVDWLPTWASPSSNLLVSIDLGVVEGASDTVKEKLMQLGTEAGVAVTFSCCEGEDRSR